MGKRGPKPIYPWDRWFARKTRVRIVRGVHYYCQPHTMMTMIRMQASRRKVHVSVFIREQVIVFSIGAKYAA